MPIFIYFQFLQGTLGVEMNFETKLNLTCLKNKFKRDIYIATDDN